MRIIKKIFEIISCKINELLLQLQGSKKIELQIPLHKELNRFNNGYF